MLFTLSLNGHSCVKPEPGAVSSLWVAETQALEPSYTPQDIIQKLDGCEGARIPRGCLIGDAGAPSGGLTHCTVRPHPS